MAEYRVIEEGAFGDLEFEASANTREQLFEICAHAVFATMTDIVRVAPDNEFIFDVEGENDTELLYAFLSELIYIKDVEKIFLCRFVITFMEGFKLSCKAYGEPINRRKHDIKTDVKAVTYHKFEIKQTADGYYAHIILDL